MTPLSMYVRIVNWAEYKIKEVWRIYQYQLLLSYHCVAAEQLVKIKGLQEQWIIMNSSNNQDSNSIAHRKRGHKNYDQLN